MIEYRVIVHDDPRRMADLLNAGAAAGFELLGPVAPTSSRGDMIATLVRDLDPGEVRMT